MIEHVTQEAILEPLEGRVAVCDECHTTTRASAINLPWFRYRGAGSHWADTCVCGFPWYAHGARGACPASPTGAGPQPSKHYTPRGPSGRDSFYCGCKGWD